MATPGPLPVTTEWASSTPPPSASIPTELALKPAGLLTVTLRSVRLAGYPLGCAPLDEDGDVVSDREELAEACASSSQRAHNGSESVCTQDVHRQFSPPENDPDALPLLVPEPNHSTLLSDRPQSAILR